MKRLTIKSTGGVGYALALDDPQNEQEARKQLMDKFKVAVNKLAEFEDFMEEIGFDSVEELRIAEGNLEEEIRVLKKAFKELAKKYCELYCEYCCNRAPCRECENGDPYFIQDEFIQQAKESEKDDL